jgi:hypothetical protein
LKNKATTVPANKLNKGEPKPCVQRKVFSQFALHKLLYQQARQRFPLGAQIVVRIFAKVADALPLQVVDKYPYRLPPVKRYRN